MITLQQNNYLNKSVISTRVLSGHFYSTSQYIHMILTAIKHQNHGISLIMTIVNKKAKKIKKIFGWTGVVLSISSFVIAVIVVNGSFLDIHKTYFHQTGIRWLAEGVIAGLLLGAIGFWEND